RFNYGEKAYFQAFSYPTSMALALTPTDGVIFFPMSVAVPTLMYS
ncbi:unnamed protein product, partial [marine sediment metagenome]